MLDIIARVVVTFLLAVFTGSFLATACLADEVTSKENTWGSPVDGGRILFGSIGEASNLIPYLTADSASHEVADLIYVAPLRYNKDLQVEPWAAESWSMEDEGRLMRFTLRKGILWEDGVELTTADVAYTCKVVADPATGSPYAEDFSRIKNFRIIDRYTFEVEYDHFFARSVSTWMQPILPRHLLEGQNIRNTPFSRKPVGAGPYRLKSWEPGSRIILEASPSYFAGKPHIAEVVYRIIPDNATMFMETRAGRLDVLGLSPLQYLRQTSSPAFEREFNKFRYLDSSYVFLGFNLQHPFFKDVRVRRAISQAIDRESIIQGVLMGQGIPAFGPFKPGVWAYHPTLKPMPQNVAAARALLAEAGFTDSAGVGRQGGQCRQRLVEFVRQPGGHLPQRCQLAGLDGVIAGFAQDALGGFQLCQPLLELGRTLDHLGFEPGMGGPQFIGSQQAFGLAPVALPEQVSHGRHQGAGEAGQ